MVKLNVKSEISPGTRVPGRPRLVESKKSKDMAIVTFDKDPVVGMHGRLSGMAVQIKNDCGFIRDL